MDLDRLALDTDSLDRLAAFTGLGWTSSLCGFVLMGLGYDPGLLERFVPDTGVLLYLGAGFFVATLGLDHLARRMADDGPDSDAEPATDGTAQPAD